MTNDFFETTGHAKPIISSIYTADPSAVVGQDGRIYIYASHDCFPKNTVDAMDRYHVFSSCDLVNWRDEGEILRSDDVEWGLPGGGVMWAPDCIYKNGKYYFYFPHPDKEPWGQNFQIGLAISEHPAKNFKDIGYIKGIGGYAMIDPKIFIDDDGKNYLYYGGCGMAKCVELEDDMITVKGEVHDMEGLVDYHEGTWVFKRNGIYYLTYPDNLPWRNRMAYAVSDNPLGPWDYKGFYLAPTGSETSHGSVVEYKGKWYCFYHNCAISGDSWLRSVCMDELFFNEDGTIKPVMQTSCTADPYITRPAFSPDTVIYEAEGVKIYEASVTEDHRKAVLLKNPGSFIQFKKIQGFSGGRVNIRFTYARNGQNAAVRLIANYEDHGGINMVSTGSEFVFSNEANYTLKLKPGKVNEIRVEQLCGEVFIKNLIIEPIDPVN